MTKVKICGITNLEDAMIAADAGADMLGFNFYEKSPRFIAPASAKAIIEKLPRSIASVGVFVNSSLSSVRNVYSDLSLDLVQLHGNEDAAFVHDLATTAGAKVIKAIRVSGDFQPEDAPQYKVDYYILDTDSKLFGGSGEIFDWKIAVKFKESFPELFLAGGLNPENVKDAIRIVRPFAVDVCSGVEAEKGRKDPVMVCDFVRNAKGAL